MSNAGFPTNEATIHGMVQQLLAERHQWHEQAELAYYRGWRAGAFISFLAGAIVGFLL